MALGRLKEAVKDLKQVVKFAPLDKDAKSKFTECENEYKRQLFEKAIAVDDAKSVVDSFGDVAGMIVEERYFLLSLFDTKHTFSYSGAVLDSIGGITLDFIKQMMDNWKYEKTLHKKYSLLIMLAAKEIFDAQPPIVDIDIPKGAKMTVCGDIHGQFYDLIHIFGK